MTETDANADRFSLVPGAHRLIRAIDGKEGPFAGALVTYDDGVAVCVPTDRLNEWPGWAYSDAEHVCGVVDIRRRPDGHDALLPWCTQRVESFLGRRQIADAPLTPGELGTLVASVLRGVRELGGEDTAAGDWWLTGAGRPVFVHGEGGAPRACTAALIERIAQHTVDRATIRILDEAVAALKQSRHHADEDRLWEEQLFAIAAPRALRLDVFAPERVSEIGVQRVIGAKGLPESRASARSAKPHSNAHYLRDLLEVVRNRTGNVLSHLGHGASRRHDTGRRSPRRRSVLLAASLGVAVLTIGLMWPSGGSEADAEAEPGPTAMPSAPPSPASEQEQEQEQLTESDDVLAAVPALLDTLRQCVDTSSTCTEAVTETAHIPSDGVVTLGSEASRAVLVEDYGDVAVVRLTPVTNETAEQMVVLERHNELWLLRDVYDIAKQPE